MYVVTNRSINARAVGLEKFGERPNEKGPNELRLFRVEKADKKWNVELLDDALTKKQVESISKEFKLNLDTGKQYFASLDAAADIVRRARKQKRNVLIFVHGFNNNMEAVFERAFDLEKQFKLQVIPFSWPADGGGVRGVLNYKSDKRDAKISTGALDRVLAKVHEYLQLFTEPVRLECWEKAGKEFGNNPEGRDARYAELLEKSCPFTVNFLAHSMGNYLYKHLLLSSASESSGQYFDNVVLAAADANNKDHVEWIDRIECRGRVYVTINENDSALAASRAKSGQDQLARLGHYLADLDSRRARYVNFTEATWVKSSHAYFGGMALKNKQVQAFFASAFNGQRAEAGLRYQASGNYFEVT